MKVKDSSCTFQTFSTDFSVAETQASTESPTSLAVKESHTQ